MSRRPNFQVETVGDHLVAFMHELGCRYIFTSPGSEWPPLWEALSKLGGEGPRLVTSRHELLAVSMALGYHKHTGELPWLALHATAGMLNTAMGLRTALHEQIPMVVLTGESVTFGERSGVPIESQWLRSLGDVDGPARAATPFTKWSARLADGSVLEPVLRHAAEIALAPPRGPVLVSLPLEILLQLAGDRVLQAHGLSLTFSAAPEQALRNAAEEIARARNPLIVTESAGRRREAVAALVDLADLVGAPVTQSIGPAYLNFPRGHPLHLGYDLKPYLNESDLCILVGCKVPIHPPSALLGKKVISLSEEPLGTPMPMGGLPPGPMLLGPLDDTLRRLAQAVRAATSGRSGWAEMVARRREQWAEEHRRMQESWIVNANGDEALLAELARLLPPETVVVEEVTVHYPWLLRHLCRDLPGTFYSRFTGGLGVMVGEALGVKLASPETPVMCIMGDGCFHYAPTLSALGVSQEYGLPIMIVVLNNGGYSSMRASHRLLFPDGYAASHEDFVGVDIRPSPDYAGLAACYGGYGARVATLDGMASAVGECLRRMGAGQACILDLTCGY